MKPFRILFILLACLLTQRAAAQTLRLQFVPQLGNQLLIPGEDYIFPAQNTTLTTTTFRFYISSIRLLQGANKVYTEPVSYHLIDMEDTSTLRLSLPVPEGVTYDHISFLLGIDSATNAAGAQGGDLDPTKGMYWAWQSGYVNLKLEGTCPVCATRKHQFQYHLGGFQDGNYCAQPVLLPLPKTTAAMIIVDAAILLQGVNLAVMPTIMTPGSEAIALSVQAAKMFHAVPIKEQ